MKTTIRNRITRTFIAFFLVLIVCVVAVIQIIYRELSLESYAQAHRYESVSVANAIETIHANIKNECNNLIFTLNDTLHLQTGPDYPDFFSSYTSAKIRTSFESSFLKLPYAASIAVLYNNGDLYLVNSDSRLLLMQNVDDATKNLRDNNITTTGRWLFNGELDSEIFGGGGIRYAKSLREIGSNITLGYIIITLNEHDYYSAYIRDAKLENSRYLLINDGLIVSSDDREIVDSLSNMTYNDALEYSGATIDSLNNDNGFIKHRYAVDNFILLSGYDISADIADLNTITIFIIIVAVIVMLFLYLAVVALSRHIASPIATLSAHMVRTPNELPQKLTDRSRYHETDLLIDSYNMMIDQNHQLFLSIGEEKRERRQLEMRLLQAQIKPHFLYNTLDTVYCLNGMGRVEEANFVIKALAGYYRLALSHGAELISLKKEFNAVERYLEIQSVRYNDTLSYDIELSDELGEIIVPKLTLQPLVENAIYHGIKPTHRRGNIQLFAKSEGDSVIISVKDDGMGMTDERFRQCVSGEVDDKDEYGFGLKNVVDRIRLFYGEKGWVEHVKVQSGCHLALHLPMRMEKEEEHREALL